jgi:hypothetical protein
MTSSHPTPVPCQWFARLASALDRRSAPRLALLFLGALLARCRRTVTSWIRAAQLGDQFRLCDTTVAAAGKKADSIATRLVLEAIKPLVAGAERLTIALDDTPTERYGPHVQAPALTHINPAKIGGGPDLPSILTPLVAEILKVEPPRTGTRGGLELPVEVMGDAVERPVEIAGAIQQRIALARQPLDAARLANRLPEPDQELYARAGGIVATGVRGGALDAPLRLEGMSHEPPRCADPATIAAGPIRRGSSLGDEGGPRAACRRRIRPGPGPCRRRRASSSKA